MIRRFLEDRSGAPAVEFALIAPILAGIVVVGWNLWWGQTSMQQAKTALRAGAEYYDAGGLDDSAATTVVRNAWSPLPADAAVSSTRACYCNGVTISCGTICPAGQVRTIYVTLSTTWTGKGAFANQSQSQQEVLRVQ